MVTLDNLGKKLYGVLQSQSHKGNDLEFKYNVTESCNTGVILYFIREGRPVM